MSRVRKERVARQIRVYEESADFIEEMVKRKPAHYTYADVVEEIFMKAYPELYPAVAKAKARARNLIDDALGLHFIPPKRPEPLDEDS
jgi:hypothetical protein